MRVLGAVRRHRVQEAPAEPHRLRSLLARRPGVFAQRARDAIRSHRRQPNDAARGVPAQCAA